MINEISYYKNNRPEILPLLPSHYSKVLEIGCGEGNFSIQLSKATELWGVELNSEVGEIASTKMTKVIIGKYDQVVSDLPNNYFDLIICNDVIEHMEDHDWFLDSIRSKLQSSGKLILSVPNVRHIRNLFRLVILKDWEYRDSLTLDRTHLRFFTKKSLNRTLKQHKFVVEELIGINESKNFFNKVIMFLLNVLTIGNSGDTRYLQFAVRVNKGDD